MDATTAPAKRVELQKVITVRMPQSLHESLKSEAQDASLSMNQLSLRKLQQPLLADPA